MENKTEEILAEINEILYDHMQEFITAEEALEKISSLVHNDALETIFSAFDNSGNVPMFLAATIREVRSKIKKEG